MPKAVNINETSDWNAWFDGSAKPNPGACLLACIVRGPAGEVHQQTRALGYGDSSDAEYQALIAALELLLALLGPAPTVSILLRGDSQVVINDVLGSTAAAVRLQDYRARACTLMAQLPGLRLKWVPRHKNTEADALLRAPSV